MLHFGHFHVFSHPFLVVQQSIRPKLLNVKEGVPMNTKVNWDASCFRKERVSYTEQGYPSWIYSILLEILQLLLSLHGHLNSLMPKISLHKIHMFVSSLPIMHHHNSKPHKSMGSEIHHHITSKIWKVYLLFEFLLNTPSKSTLTVFLVNNFMFVCVLMNYFRSDTCAIREIWAFDWLSLLTMSFQMRI